MTDLTEHILEIFERSYMVALATTLSTHMTVTTKFGVVVAMTASTLDLATMRFTEGKVMTS